MGEMMSCLQSGHRSGATSSPRFTMKSKRSVSSRLILWLDRQRQRIHLSLLDDRLLEDIGVSRQRAEAESRRWD